MIWNSDEEYKFWEIYFDSFFLVFSKYFSCQSTDKLTMSEGFLTRSTHSSKLTQNVLCHPTKPLDRAYRWIAQCIFVFRDNK